MSESTKLKLDKLREATIVTRRVGGKVPVVFKRYATVLHHLETWQRKAQLVKTKLKIYRKKAAYYQKRTGV